MNGFDELELKWLDEVIVKIKEKRKMATPDPLTLLEKELHDLEHSLEKSIWLYQNQRIDCATHLMHKENLRKKINAYKEAIQALKTCNDGKS